jgi:spermidine synthase
MVEHGGMRQIKYSFFLPVMTACGFASSIGQIVILRELLVIFYGNELSIGLIFTGWLLWTALGSSVGGRYGARITQNASFLPTALVLLALLLPSSVLWIRATRIIWAIPTGEMIGPFSMLLISLTGTSLFCFCSGALFGLAWASLSAISANGSDQPLLIYLGEALGAATGGLFFYFVLLPRTSIFNATLLTGLIVLVLAAVLFRIQRCLSIKCLASLVVVLVAFTLVAGLLISSADLDSKSRHWQWGPRLATVRDTPFQNLALLADANQFSLFANGLLSFSVPDPQTSEYAVHVAMLQHPAPEKVLLIGGGVGGLLAEVLKHPGIRRVDYVEPDPEVIELAEEFLPPSATAPLLDRRVHLFHADAGSFFRTADSRYDVVIMQLGDPVNAEMNRFYTTECYARLSKLLNPGGIFSFAITSSPEMVGPTEAQLLRSVTSTLRSVFPGVLVIPGENARFLASHSLENLTAEPDELIRRLVERRLDLQYVREYYLFDYLNPTRINYLQAALGQSQPPSVNRDFEPTCYFNSLVVATRQIHPLLGEAFLALSRVGRLPFWTLIAILSLGMILVGGHGSGTARKVIRLNVVIVGGIEMVLEMVLLLGFQILEGFLYRQLALIIAFFMAGISLGTGFLAELASRISNPMRGFVFVQSTLTFYLGGVLAFLYWVHQYLQANQQTPLPMSLIFSVLALTAGILGGCHFTLGVQASAKLPGYSGTTGPGLYAMDLLGATGGILFASLFALPLYGLPTTMLVLTIFCLAGVVKLMRT